MDDADPTKWTAAGPVDDGSEEEYGDCHQDDADLGGGVPHEHEMHQIADDMQQPGIEPDPRAEYKQRADAFWAQAGKIEDSVQEILGFLNPDSSRDFGDEKDLMDLKKSLARKVHEIATHAREARKLLARAEKVKEQTWSINHSTQKKINQMAEDEARIEEMLDSLEQKEFRREKKKQALEAKKKLRKGELARLKASVATNAKLLKETKREQHNAIEHSIAEENRLLELREQTEQRQEQLDNMGLELEGANIQLDKTRLEVQRELVRKAQVESACQRREMDLRKFEAVDQARANAEWRLSQLEAELGHLKKEHSSSNNNPSHRRHAPQAVSQHQQVPSTRPLSPQATPRPQPQPRQAMPLQVLERPPQRPLPAGTEDELPMNIPVRSCAGTTKDTHRCSQTSQAENILLENMAADKLCLEYKYAKQKPMPGSTATSSKTAHVPLSKHVQTSGPLTGSGKAASFAYVPRFRQQERVPDINSSNTSAGMLAGNSSIAGSADMFAGFTNKTGTGFSTASTTINMPAKGHKKMVTKSLKVEKKTGLFSIRAPKPKAEKAPDRLGAGLQPDSLAKDRMEILAKSAKAAKPTALEKAKIVAANRKAKAVPAEPLGKAAKASNEQKKKREKVKEAVDQDFAFCIDLSPLTYCP
ncbi:hypothetical protein Micbo1qcDRAFT_173781 [Microdochium bolleyi]|uniref:Uncharacterized protein n=1 Tax=Microdochium bolleyi TaxID=196109 RepID=A0A136J6G6_9PEZI|nr:hypothetical protein Micbo1qcDRAFT_173781 [Microdochium bolleyi]